MADENRNRRIRDLHAIGMARESHGHVEKLLDLVVGSRGEPIAAGPISLVDYNHSRLDGALAKFGTVSPDEAAANVSPAAGAALRAFKEALHPVDEIYGLTAGPDRTAEQAEATQEALVSAAFEARAAFMEYWAEVGGLELPDVGQFVKAMEGERAERAERAPPARPVTTVPRVRLPLEGAVTARRSRALAGLAYGSAALAYVQFVSASDKGNAHAGMLALGALSSLLGTVSIGSSIARRAAADDAGIAADASAVYDDVQGMVDASESMAKVGPPDPADVAALREAMLKGIRTLGERVRRIDRLAARAGYDLDPAPAPAPAP